MQLTPEELEELVRRTVHFHDLFTETDCQLTDAQRRIAELEAENARLLERAEKAEAACGWQGDRLRESHKWKEFYDQIDRLLSEAGFPAEGFLLAEDFKDVLGRLRKALDQIPSLIPLTQVMIAKTYFEALVEDQKRLDWLESQNYSEFEAATHFKPDEQNPPGKKWGYWREAIDEDRQKKEASK